MKLMLTLICTIALVGCYDPKDARIAELEATVQEQSAAMDRLMKADEELKASDAKLKAAADELEKNELELESADAKLKRACGLK